MNTTRIFVGAMVISIFVWMCVGCANNEQASAAANGKPTAKTYESQDLAKTGKRTSGEALQAADPAVTARGGN